MDGRESQSIPENEPVISLKDQLVTALEAGDLEATIQALQNLDKMLAGKKESYLDQHNANYPDLTRDIERFLDKVRWRDFASLTVPLLGGYSRLLLYAEDGKASIELSRNASPEVEQRWNSL